MPPARKRRSRNQSPSTSEIVAPGGGTQADVDKLAKNLGMESNSVSAILNSEGSGVASARRSRSSGADATESAPVAASSAWADFMTDDDGLDKDSSKDTAQQADEGTVAKRAKTADIDIAPKSEVTGEGYVLPITFKEAKPGVLAQTGSLDAKMVGRIKRPLVEIFDLQEPTLLGYESIFDKQLVSVIATSSSACHSIVITADGSAYSWGRNESGQCGFGETSACVPVPKKIEHGSKFVAAAVGKSHSILVADDGVCYAVGLNKYGQCGVNSSIEAILGWKKCVFSGATGAKIVQAGCGENFSVLLDSEGFMYSAGLGEFGQLGNGETGEYFIAANKIGFGNSTKFERRSVFVHKPGTSMEELRKPPVPMPDSDNIRIGSIACGKHHTIAVEAPLKDNAASQRVFTWGGGGYGVLGHGVQVDQYTPQLVNTFLGPLFQSNSPTRACAGAHCSLVLTGNGHVYYFGKHRSVGEATMRPALVDVLANNSHVVNALDAGGQTVVCSTTNGVTVSWGVGQAGELGYGAGNPKSSAKPKFIEKLDKVLITDVSGGYGHTLFLIRDEDEEDKKVMANIARIETGDIEAFIKKWSK
eukprot:scaffold6388_cov267-Chaetoceros_neogracile.AAC.1